jgi:hypothetical protein
MLARSVSKRRQIQRLWNQRGYTFVAGVGCAITRALGFVVLRTEDMRRNLGLV